MKRYIAYAWSVLVHKWYVFQGCRIVGGVPLWRALIHDWTKFLPVEFFAYARHFRNPDGTKRNFRNPDGSYNPNEQGENFKRAWLHHQRNPHHWQAWISIGDFGELSAMIIPQVFMREMVADWYGAGKSVNGEDNPFEWYMNNKHKMILHPYCSAYIDVLMERNWWKLK